MGLWEELLETSVGVCSSWSWGIPQPAFKIAPWVDCYRVSVANLLWCDWALSQISTRPIMVQSHWREPVGWQHRFHCVLPSNPIQMEASSWCVAPLVSIMPWDSPSSYGTHHIGWVLRLRWTFAVWPSKFRTLASMLMEKILVFRIFLWLPLKPRNHKHRAAGWKAFSRWSGCWNYKQVMLTDE